jgi:hypothetical protein
LRVVRRLALLISALLVPLLPAAPAYAATNVICVGSPVGTCNQNVGTIPLAITAAGIDGMDSVILVGPGTYNDGPYQITTANTVLQGSGPGSTFLTLPDNPTGQAYLTISNGATVSDLTIDMEGGANSLNDVGLIAFNGGVADAITIDGSATQAAQGAAITQSTLTDSSVLLPLTSGRAVYGQGGNTVTDSTITGNTAFFSSSSGVEALSRLTIHAGFRGVGMDSGTVNIDNAVIELMAVNASGVAAINDNASVSPKTINARHLTVVGGGANSRGVWARAKNSTVQQNAVVNLADSIVRTTGGVDLLAEASNGLGAGLNSTAAVNVSYADFATKTSDLGANGAGGVVEGLGNVNLDPAFVDEAGGNLRLTVGSPVVDIGDPAAGGPATDRDGDARIFDGDEDSTARRDLGAYELSDFAAPDTTIDGGPEGPTSDPTPTFSFSSDPGATFVCQVDGSGFTPCSGPGATHTTDALTDGVHTFEVRASDLNGNTDATAASRAFTVDTAAPDTAMTSGPSGSTNDATPTFAFTGEPGATFECQVDAGAFTACTSPFTTASLGDGPHTFSVRATDAATNVDDSPATRAFTVDTVAPDTTFTRTPGKTVFSRRVRFKFTSNEAGVTFECKRDTKAFKPCTSPYRFRVKLGKHVLRVRAVDAAGNVDPTPARYRFKRLPKP